MGLRVGFGRAVIEADLWIRVYLLVHMCVFVHIIHHVGECPYCFAPPWIGHSWAGEYW